MQFGGGLATQEGANSITDDQSPDMLNTRPLGRGSYAPRNGISRVGDANATPGSCSSLWNFARGTQETLIRGRGTILEYLNGSAVWTAVPGISAFTADQQFGFANDEANLYAGNGVDNFFSWDGVNPITQFAGNPKGNIFEFYLRRLFITGIAATPARVFYSVILAPTDFSGAGSGDFTVGEGGDPITAMRVFITPTSNTPALFVFKKSSRIYQVTFDTSGSLSINELKRDTGAVNQRSTVQVENDLLYIDQGNNIVNLGYRENIQNQLRTENSTQGIDRSTISYNFGGACSVYWKKRRIVFVATRDNSTFNNTVLAYFYDFNSWWRWRGLNANQFAIYLGEPCWASSIDQNVYKYDETKFDDLGAPISTHRHTKDIEFADRNGVPLGDRYKKARFIAVRGLISEGGLMRVKIRYDSDSASDVSAQFLGNAAAITSGNASVSFGRTVFGRDAFGGSALSPTDFPMRQFFVVVSLSGDYSALMARIITEMDVLGTPYVIDMITLWAELEEDEKWPAEIKI